VVTFNSRAAGTAAATWRADDRWARAPAFDPHTIHSLVVIAAHPDDETLGAGGIIADCAARGVPVEIVIVTDGAASHDHAELGTRRAAEARAAVAILAPAARLHFLKFADGATRENRAAITAALATVLAAVPPGSTVFAPWRGDGHRDHRVVGEIVAGLVDPDHLREYPIWMWHWGEPDHPDIPWPRMYAVTIEPAVKRRALAAYRSQITGVQPVLSANMREHFDADREFVMTSGDAIEQYLEQTYARRDDPWSVQTRWYEQRKRALTLASLPVARYGRALELGCSIGVLTAELAERCDELIAVDLSHAAVHRAQVRLAGRTGVEIRQLDIRVDIPPGPFDLVVISEVGYYLTAVALEKLCDDLEATLAPHATVLACHWRHPAQQHLLTGDEVHAILGKRGLKQLAHHVEADFVLDVVSPDERSVARQEGIV
jgi:LmbE family N-acetylglucosaminyl deacetylase